MIDNLQCQTHTRTPWGSSPHRYDPRIRYLAMGLLCAFVLAVFTASLVFVGNSAVKAYSSSSSSDNDDPTASTSIPLSTEIPLSTTNIGATRSNQTTSNGITTITVHGLQSLLSPTITVSLGKTTTADVG
ncbi:hypothetical protein A9Z42_0065740 [Trichoderma parareesei]|uniref:Uncharacterized protein n=1 Tax=Trichoderma parareesei TaxID=858221 RepID=A0A2H2ZJG7_TRIPA|nr:hypothetical protein A9Z42_0065740 [Trichoderma parareesei]